MADEALSKQMDSDKPRRACAWCGADISHRRWSAKTCDLTCKEKLRHRRRYPDSKPFREHRTCDVCGIGFVAKTSTRRFCGADCRYAHWLEADREGNTLRARMYRQESPDRYRRYEKMRRDRDGEKLRKQGRDRYEKMKKQRPEEYKEMLRTQGERERRRNAERALSLLILPMQTPPET